MAQVKVNGGNIVSFLNPDTGAALAESGMLFSGWYDVAVAPASAGYRRIVVKTDNKVRHADVPENRISGHQS